MDAREEIHSDWYWLRGALNQAKEIREPMSAWPMGSN